MASFALRRNVCFLLCAGVLVAKLSSDAKGTANIISFNSNNDENTAQEDIIDSRDNSASRKLAYLTKINEERVNVKDIRVVSVYNPVIEKEEYFFMKLESNYSSRLPDEEYKVLFAGTPLADRINAETSISDEEYTYKSIFDEDIIYECSKISIIGNNINGYYNYDTLNIGEEIDFKNYSKSVNCGDKNYKSEVSFTALTKDSFYYDGDGENALQIAMQTLSEAFGYPEDATITMTELSELLSSLKEGQSIERTN